MDFLNPKKERRNRIILLVGYGLVALAIGIAAILLLYWSYGYNLDKQGNVTQNGLVFTSSQPTGAHIFLNGSLYKSSTNTRMFLPAGNYDMKITAAGYRDWQRPITVVGGDVQHFDYPFLFPTTLKTTDVANLAANPSLTTQSPDKRWLLLGEADKAGRFLQYDFKNPAQPVATELALPEGSFTASADAAQTWSAAEWSSDNKHVLLLHTFTTAGAAAHEYILMDRETPANSVSLTSTLGLSTDEVPSLFNQKTDQFYIYDQAAQTLRVVPADNSTIISQLAHILAYKTYGNNIVLYVTDHLPSGKAADGHVSAVLQDGQKITTLRTLPDGSTNYLLNLAQYSGDWYVAVATNNDNGVYVYKNPQIQPEGASADNLPKPWRRLPVAHPTYLSFSSNTQFLLAENAQQFAVYDAENVVMYHYTAKQPLDQPQVHAVWMDGDRLIYTSGGKLVVFDYDYRNQQTLQAMNPAYTAAFAPDYSYLYSVGTGADTKPALQSTALVVTKG